MTRRWIATGALAALSLTLAGCTAGTAHPAALPTAGPGSVKLALVAYDTCDSLLAKLRAVASSAVQPYGLTGPLMFGGKDIDMRAAAPTAAGAAGGAAFSGTNNQEVGVDEPDMVKTDGRRIVTVQNGVLRVVDAASRTVTGVLRLDNLGGTADLLLQGDRALVFENNGYYMPADGARPSAIEPTGPRILLVDLTGAPRIVTSYAIDGQYVDARQVGDRVNVVIRSQPRIVFPWSDNATDAARLAKNRDIIKHAPIADWLPRISVTEGGTTTRTSVPCGRVLHPAAFQQPNVLTVLTFHLDSGKLGTGDPVGVVADGGTVYATDKSLYVADDERMQTYYFRGGPMIAPGAVAPGAGAVAGVSPVKPSAPVADPGTTIYRFDTGGAGRPAFVGSGHVPGYLVNQYALSEWSGVLRVATTTGTSWAVADGKPAGAQTSESAVYTLGIDAPNMPVLGHVGGLGREERIYAVRYAGPVAFVVTFRQTDPLFTVDLSDPARPTVRGELPLTGYSSYLHPVSDTRLIGIGQSADAMGHVGGTQVSVFDVSDLSTPRKLGGVSFPNGNSAAEYDPHAFLYWPATNLVVAPLNAWNSGVNGVVLLRVTDSGPTEIGTVSQPADPGGQESIERSLIVGDTLWTVSYAGLMATDSTNLRQTAWLPFR